jgi:hypothetical protein
MRPRPPAAGRGNAGAEFNGSGPGRRRRHEAADVPIQPPAAAAPLSRWYRFTLVPSEPPAAPLESGPPRGPGPAAARPRPRLPSGAGG